MLLSGQKFTNPVTGERVEILETSRETDGKLWKFYPLVDYATLLEQIESK